MGTKSPLPTGVIGTPEFDAAAEAAGFCARRRALVMCRRYEREAAVATTLRRPADELETLDELRHYSWREYIALGGTLAELYGLDDPDDVLGQLVAQVAS